MPHKPEDKEEADALRCALGKRVRAAREARGWSQDTLAEEIGVGGVMLGRYERGEKFPSHLTLVRLAQTLRTTTDALLGLPAPRRERAMDDAELLRALRRLSDAQREAVVAIVGGLAASTHPKRG
jgi:transcriptional regulator with XRE-family HTH domain